MATIRDIKIALDVNLADLSGSTPIAWENINYKPVHNTTYIRPTLLFSPSTKLDMEGDQLIQGIYQIDVFAPVNIGMSDLLNKMDDIFDLFREATLISNDTTVYVNTISSNRFSTEQDWIVGTISVSFSCYK